MRSQDLLDRNPEEWREATYHPFLDGVREGNLPAGAFESWLEQDYLFAGDLLVFQARLLARASRPHQAVLAGGLTAVEAELGWFEEKAGERDLQLETQRHSTTAAYREFLTGLEDEPYPISITALWALERAYLEAWRNAAPGDSEYREFVEHWTTQEFADYVADLEAAADSALEAADEKERQRAESAFLEVCRLERGFWEMAGVLKNTLQMEVWAGRETQAFGSMNLSRSCCRRTHRHDGYQDSHFRPAARPFPRRDRPER